MVTLCPGFKHVDAFDESGEYEDETEVSYVTLDLGTNVDRVLLPNTSEYRLIGLDTATPMLQLSGFFFKGAHEQLIGTEILFTDGRDDSNLSRRFVVPIGTTEKRIQFRQVEVSAKDAGPREETREDRSQKQTTRVKGRGASRRGRGQVAPLLHEHGETVLDFNTQQSESV